MRVWASVKQFREEIATAPEKKLYKWATRHPEHVWKSDEESRNSTMLLRVEAVLKAMDDRTL